MSPQQCDAVKNGTCDQTCGRIAGFTVSTRSHRGISFAMICFRRKAALYKLRVAFVVWLKVTPTVPVET